jgi:hypothetical protein
MNMLGRLGPVLLVLLATTAGFGHDKQPLRVLYAGNPGSERMTDFQSFLTDHFDEVGTISYQAITADDARTFDVVIFDWTSVLPRDEKGSTRPDIPSFEMPQTPKLPDDWDRPSILIGAAGERVAELFQSKIDWL